MRSKSDKTRATANRTKRRLWLCGVVLAMTSAPAFSEPAVSSAERTTDEHRLTFFEHYIGRWVGPPDSPFLLDHPDKKDFIAYEWEWGPRRNLVRVFHGYPKGNRGAAIVEGLISWDPSRGRTVFTQTNTEEGFLFEGEYARHAQTGLQKTYDVSYAAGDNRIPEPQMPGTTRRFREVFTPTGPDRLAVTLEVFDFVTGSWRPWGRYGGRYDLIRLSESSQDEAPVARPRAQWPDIPARARERLEHALGRWHVRADFYDAQANVVRTVEWENEAHYVIEGRVVLLTHDAPSLDMLSKTFLYYGQEDGKLHFVDVNQKGDLWLLSGDLEGLVIHSQPKKTADGREMVIRFTHQNIEPDSFEARMDYSLDNGKTWRLSQRQYLTRIDHGDS